jgi:hypothetical protein
VLIIPALLAISAAAPEEVIPWVRESVPADTGMTFVAACPSGLRIDIRRYGYARPHGPGATVSINGRRIRGQSATALEAALSEETAVYRLYASCDRDRPRAWLAIEMGRSGASGEVAYMTSSALIAGDGIQAFNPPRPVGSQSFWN